MKAKGHREEGRRTGGGSLPTAAAKSSPTAAPSPPQIPGRPFRVYHAVLLPPLLVFLAAGIWLGRETFERYRFNVLRHPQVAQESQWSRMTGWMPLDLRQGLTRLVLGSLPQSAPAVVSEYVDRLEKLVEIFPYDGLLQLELSRKLYEQIQRGTVSQAQKVSHLLNQALEHNRLAFLTYFDVEAYDQIAWTHMELHRIQTILKQKEEADASLRAAIEGFQRACLLNPADVSALERLAYIYNYIASTTRKREDWLVSLDYSKRLLEAEHDNTNAFYFIGIAYENLAMRDEAVTYYLKTLNFPSTLPADKRMWDRKVIYDHLVKLGYVKKPPEQK